jgi:hypothetical protein
MNSDLRSNWAYRIYLCSEQEHECRLFPEVSVIIYIYLKTSQLRCMLYIDCKYDFSSNSL